MDQVYRLYDHQTLPKINLKDYFQQYNELLKSFRCHKIDEQSDKKIFQLMDIDLSQTRALLMTHYCSIDNLTVPMEAANVEEREKQGCVNIPENILNNTSLETIKVLKILSKEASLKPKFQNGIPITFKNDDSRLICYTKQDSMTPNEEFLVHVRIYEPFQSQPRSLRYRSINTLPVLKLKHVISIPGCQTLYELRRKIVCQSDLSIATEISESPNQKPGPMAKHIYKSGFFYIEDTFYSDTSASANIDYSKVILEWAATRGIGPFKVASMDVRINSLCARFGFPWVYQHQGCCEHLIVLSDARLVTMDDILTLSVYPKIERIRPLFGKNCIMCGILNVHWIITEHDRIPHDISYFCNKCFKSYNYVDGKKVGNFKAYNYPCIPELLSVRKCSNI